MNADFSMIGAVTGIFHQHVPVLVEPVLRFVDTKKMAASEPRKGRYLILATVLRGRMSLHGAVPNREQQ